MKLCSQSFNSECKVTNFMWNNNNKCRGTFNVFDFFTFQHGLAPTLKTNTRLPEIFTDPKYAQTIGCPITKKERPKSFLSPVNFPLCGLSFVGADGVFSTNRHPPFVGADGVFSTNRHPPFVGADGFEPPTLCL